MKPLMTLAIYPDSKIFKEFRILKKLQTDFSYLKD